MIEICEMQQCTGCEACVQICPVNCISMTENAQGFRYPTIDGNKCLGCERCINICHNNINLPVRKAEFFMGWHKNLEVLKNSSSGGAFTALAQLVLERDGVVFGAYFDENSRLVKQIAVENVKELSKLRWSKYYQGCIDESYKLAEKYLKSKSVLFSGTSCQIAGLYAFLGRDYNNLLTVDILCHGVASKKVIDAYIISKEKRYRKKIKNFKFRIKPDDGDWIYGEGVKMKLEFEDGTHIIENKGTDTYFVGFNNYLFLRESCYQCKYVGLNRISDFTIADFWGVNINKIPKLQRKYGVSLILVNSDKGKNFLSLLTRDMIIEKINPDEAVPYNQALVKPSTYNKYRRNFFENIEKKNFDNLIYKYYWIYYLKIKIEEHIGTLKYKKITSFIKGAIKKGND